MNITDIQKAIAGEELDGWLFFNFLHRDPLSNRILDLDTERINSRPWYYLVPREGMPVKLCNAVEPDILDDLPGEIHVYTGREELLLQLKRIVDEKGVEWGAQYSKELTTVSTLDYGTALLLGDAGMRLKSSASLIQRLNGLIDEDGIRSHIEASGHLYEIIGKVWNRIRKELPGGLTEIEVQNWILQEFSDRKLITEHMPIVASGSNSGNPHYAPENHRNSIQPDAVLQLDIWAKTDSRGSVFADISWVGWTGNRPPDAVTAMFTAVTAARDRCREFIESRITGGIPVSGADADAETRNVLTARGYGDLIKHRTGHGIDRELHGSGTGLDSIEFPDRRLLIEGSCFSIEPGLYSAEYGMRTEIDAYISKGRLEVAGPGIQNEILKF